MSVYRITRFASADMDAATEGANQTFGKMIEAGLIDGDSLHPHMGEVVQSF